LVFVQLLKIKIFRE